MPHFDCTNICFWYIPKRMRDLEKTNEWWDELDGVSVKSLGKNLNFFASKSN